MGTIVEPVAGAPWMRLKNFVSGVLGSACPGMVLILVFRQDLFERLDLGKLLFVAIGITLPVTASNTLIFAGILWLNRRIKIAAIRSETGFSEIFTSAVAISFPPLYGPVVFRVMTGWGDLRTALVVGAVMELASLFLWFRIWKVQRFDVWRARDLHLAEVPARAEDEAHAPDRRAAGR